MLTRRQLLGLAGALAAGFVMPASLRALAAGTGTAYGGQDPKELKRLLAWTDAVRVAELDLPAAPFGRAVALVGEQALGSPYEGGALDAYIRAGGDPTDLEPLTLSLTSFDCVTLVESCIAVARLAGRSDQPTWDGFGRQIEGLRYRGGRRGSYVTRLHYFSEWVRDNGERGGLHELGRELGGMADTRPLRFMSSNRDSYPALADDDVFARIVRMERRLDDSPRWVVPKERIDEVADEIETGDIIAFATSIAGLDASHTALAYRREGVLRILHAPSVNRAVEVTESTLAEYAAGNDRITGILVARPLRG